MWYRGELHSTPSAGIAIGLRFARGSGQVFTVPFACKHAILADPSVFDV